MTDAETLARIIFDIEKLLANYIDPANQTRDANLTIEEIFSAMDRNDAIGAAENILPGGRG